MAGCVVEAGPDELPLSEAALSLRMRYQAVRDLVLTGTLVGRKPGAFWLVERESVERYRIQKAAAA